MNLNKAQVIGRVTQTPKAKALPNGTMVTSFSIATNHIYKKDGKKYEMTEYHNIVAFAGLAEVITQYVIKGQEIYIEGRLQTRSWEDSESGKKMYRTEIIAEKMEFGQKPKNISSDTTTQQDTPDQEINPDDIPF